MPNPTNGNIYLELKDGENICVEVKTILGNVISHYYYSCEMKEIQLPDQAGIYIVEVLKNNLIIHSGKIIKSKQ